MLQLGGTPQIFRGEGKKNYTTEQLQRDVIQHFPSKYQSNVTVSPSERSARIFPPPQMRAY